MVITPSILNSISPKTKNEIIKFCKKSMSEYQKRYDKNNKHNDFLSMTFFKNRFKELKKEK